jgi:hypothetical protein
MAGSKSTNNPPIYKVQDTYFFLCAWTGTLCAKRAGLPGRNNQLSNAFCSWGAALAYIDFYYRTAEQQAQAKRMRETIYKIVGKVDVAPAPDFHLLQQFGGKLTFEQYQSMYHKPEYEVGMESAADAYVRRKNASAVASAKASRRSNDYIYTLEHTDKAPVAWVDDVPDTTFLLEFFNGEYENLHCIPLEAPEDDRKENTKLYFTDISTNAVNEIASDIVKEDVTVRGPLVVVSNRKIPSALEQWLAVAKKRPVADDAAVSVSKKSKK